MYFERVFIAMLLLVMFAGVAYAVNEESKRDDIIKRWIASFISETDIDPTDISQVSVAHLEFRRRLPESSTHCTRERFVRLLREVIEERTIEQ